MDATGEGASGNLEPVVQVGHPGRLHHIVFSPDKKYFLTSAYGSRGDDEILLWDANSGDKLRAFPIATHRLTPSFCLDGQAVVIGGNVWDIQTGKQRYVILDDNEVPTAVSISADTRHHHV